MEPKNLHFGGGVAQTVLNPIVLVLVLIVGVIILLKPRSKVIGPFLAAAILIPIDQVLVVGGVHFQMMRLLALFGIVRILKDKISLKRPIFSGGITKLDISLILFTVFTAIAGVLLFQQMGALIFQIGNLYTVFGLYFLLRFLIRDEGDIKRMVRTLAYIAAVIAIVMTWEIATGHNPYAILGGARADEYVNLMARDDRFRAMGCFGHPILAGCFGAVLLPLFVLLWSKRENRTDKILSIVGIVSSTAIVLTSNSSTPVMAYAGGVLAICLWPIRNWMRVLRWGIVITVVSLHMVMKAPVWHLISRIDISGGSSSYHRFQLIDQCIRHFGDWWLVGVKSTYDWGWDMWDTANQYVGTADGSGLLPLILFLAVIVYGFKYLGKARKAVGKRSQQFFVWCMGAALFANVVAFVGISYWDQTVVAWFALLASICVVTVSQPKMKKSEVAPLMSNELTQDPESEDATAESLRAFV